MNNYEQSEEFLAPVADLIALEDRSKGLKEEFDGTPRFVMQQTFDWMRSQYGSVENYLDTIGFHTAQRQQLASTMLLESANRNPLSTSDNSINFATHKLSHLALSAPPLQNRVFSEQVCVVC